MSGGFNFQKALDQKMQDHSAKPQDKKTIQSADVIAKQIAERQLDDKAILLALGQITIKEQARKTFDPDRLNELAENIYNDELHSPIVVVQIEKYKYELEKGERRLRAFKILRERYPDDARFMQIPARITDEKEYLKRRISQYSENVQKENYDTVEEAEELLHIMEKSGCTQVELSKLLNKSESYISRALALGRSSEAEKALVSEGTLSKKQLKAQQTKGQKSIAQPKQRNVMVSVDIEALKSIAKILIELAQTHGLQEITLTKSPTRKELKAIIEARAGDISRAFFNAKTDNT